MWLNRAQMLLAVMGIALAVVMVVVGAIAASWPGVLLVIGGVVIFGNGVWFIGDAKRRMRRLRPEQSEPGSTTR